MDRRKVYDLDKICRVCIVERKDMRPLFSEKVAEMLMECTNVTVEPTEGWPDKICVQCVHSVSRCHTFKQLVERNDKELREYIRKLTVHVVVEEPQPLPPAPQATQTQNALLNATKLQQSQAKLLQLQQQQQALQKQHEQQQQARMLYEKQQKLMQKQIKQQQQQQQQQIQQQQQQQQVQAATTKSNKKSTNNASASRRQAQQTATTISQPSPAPPQQQIQRQTNKKQRNQQNQQHQQSVQQAAVPQQAQLTAVPIALTATTQNQILGNATSIRQASAPQQATQQQQQQNQAQQLHATAQLLPHHTATAMPQQLVLPNGQVITAQILTHTGPPQIAQIISTAPTNSITPAVTTTATLSAPQQHFAAPQLIQTTSGQTLQIIQQPNGQQTLQLVQLVPQRAAVTTTAANNAASIIKIAEEQNTSLIEQDDDEPQFIDDDEEFETLPASGGGDNEDEEEQVETIVVEEDQMQTQLSRLDDDSLLANDGQELEYLEDVTVTTTASTGVNTLHYQHQQFLQDGDVDDDYIIEEVPDEDEIHAEEGTTNDDVIHVMDAASSDFITEEDDVDRQQQLMNEDDEQELQYAVMDDDALVEADVHEVFQAACDGSEFNTSNSGSGTAMALGHVLSSGDDCTNSLITPITSTPTRKRKAANNNNNANGAVGHARTAHNSRQLAATATRIAVTASDDDFEIDAKLIAEFIAQQTTSLSGGRYACNLCHQEFKQFKGLQGHMHQHSNWIRANCKKQPECEICFKSFKGPGMLRMHMKTHQSAARTPVCTFCGKTFKTKAILYRHRLSHRQLSFACAVDSCRKTFSSAMTLKQHVERKHAEVNANANASKFKCGECSVLFCEIDLLETHVRLTGHGANAATARAADTDASSMDDVVMLHSLSAGGDVGDELLIGQA